MTDHQPFISVVTVSFNHAEFLRKNIESVLAQEYPNFEHIVIDGGSNDGTVDILRSYPHLKWVSEPDRGQTHALNKGFRRAKGDIIAWLNSDDFYPPKVFGKIAAALREHPIVMGTCAVVDRAGNIKETVTNAGRSWYDLLRYWVYHSSPSQPSIFFRRELLERVKYPNGDYLDEDLHYCMDLDLWLRIARIAPMVHRIDDLLSYFPKYEESKTGGDWLPIYREMSRLFRRYENKQAQSERRLAIILPCCGVTSELRVTLDALQHQLLADFETIVVDSNDERDSQLRRFVREEGEQYKRLGLRYVRSGAPDFPLALNAGVSAAAAPLVAVMPPGAVPQTDFVFHASNLFQHDSLGLALPSAGAGSIAEELSRASNGVKVFDLQKLLGPVFVPPVFVARKVALLELGGVSTGKADFFATKELLFRLSYKAWQISVHNNLAFSNLPPLWNRERRLSEAYHHFVQAQLIENLRREREGDPFAVVREEHGFGVSLPAPLVEYSSRLLRSAPRQWASYGDLDEPERLQELVREAPLFAPAWKLLEERFQEAGCAGDAEQARASYESAMRSLQAI